jgi:hypothetical protein
MAFDQERFRREFERSLEIAEGVGRPIDVKAAVVRQGGRDCLRGVCPVCRTAALLSEEGKHLCRNAKCHRWLRFRREG